MSFKRQIFVNPEDAPKIPESFLITHDCTQYRIFSSNDKVNCFLGKQEGHTASQCAKLTKNITPNTNEDKETDNPHHELMISSDITIEPEVNLTENPDYSMNKRPLSISSSSHLENEDNHKTPTPEPDHTNFILNDNFIKISTRKKPKRSILTSRAIGKLEEMLKPAKSIIDDPTKHFVLNYTQFKSFLENTYNIDNPIDISREYSNDT
ncbi:hypothetical protein KPH14_001265 [Odynerus spinipes]|uniref:Uncharacterized protein n=1 Tax=Odynerus spinipes TaxID=1348599 RepID=A0AAD9VKZ1_9HYME|nr:hypothetical protein KPH14_001265 [Odynerus spinipes]